jgi:hypothetical protein
MDQGRRLDRLTGLFAGHSLGSQRPQLVVDQRQELGGSGRIALLNGIQDLCDVGH